MKKILSLLFFMVLLTAQVQAYDASAQVSTIGKTLLEKNGISITNLKFAVVSGTADNSSFATNRIVNISTNDLANAKNDNETAAVIANTLGHIINGDASKGKLTSTLVENKVKNTNETATNIVNSYKNSVQEKSADAIAINLMSNANYNPLALIVVLVKQTASSWETITGKPANADRALFNYEYTKYAYPAKVTAGYSCNEYKTFLTYANSAISSRNSKASNKMEKEIQKARKTSVSTISKFKIRGGVSGWDAAYNLLNTVQTKQTSNK